MGYFYGMKGLKAPTPHPTTATISRSPQLLTAQRQHAAQTSFPLGLWRLRV